MGNKVIHFSLPGGLRRREEEGEQGEEEGDVGEGQDGAHPQGHHGPGPRETADNHGRFKFNTIVTSPPLEFSLRLDYILTLQPYGQPLSKYRRLFGG